MKKAFKEIYDTIITEEQIMKETLQLLNKGRNEWAEIQYDDLELILRCYRHVIHEHLKECNEDTSILIKPFVGFQIIGKWIPEEMKKLNFSGQMYKQKGRIGIKARFTNGYSRKVSRTKN